MGNNHRIDACFAVTDALRRAKLKPNTLPRARFVIYGLFLDLDVITEACDRSSMMSGSVRIGWNAVIRSHDLRYYVARERRFPS